MKAHKYADLFPMASQDELIDMAEDIKKRGQLNAIIIFEDKILDGRNRHAACVKAGVEPKFKDYTGKDPLGDVISWNLHRRHLSVSQKAMLAVELKPLFEKQAKERQIAGGVEKSKVKAILPEASKGQSRDIVAKTVGVSGRSVSDAEKVKKASPERAEKVKQGEMTTQEALREIKREVYQEKVKEHANKPIGRSKVDIVPQLVLADPPWQYDFAETENREIENQYKTATVEDICNHKPATTENAVLLLWATAPKLEEALVVMNAWGFKYRSHAIWDKKKIGMGYWFRGQHELLLVGVKGKPRTPEASDRVSSIFEEVRGAHSVKPECVYKWIEKTFPIESKLEMYCRSPRKDWLVWGNEV